MASWSEFAAEAPEFAARAAEMLQRRKHKTMATLRTDGSPRISGTETELVDGELVIGSMPGAVKARDLLRDPRIAIHGPTIDSPEDNPAGWLGEVKLAGLAVAAPSADDSHRFIIDVREVVVTSLNAAGDALVIESWHEGRGYERQERARGGSAVPCRQDQPSNDRRRNLPKCHENREENCRRPSLR